MNNRVDKNLYSKYNALKVGDLFPEELQSSLIKPYTKKESVAKLYAKEGNLNIITQSSIHKDSIICDLEQLPIILKGVNQDIFDADDFKYMKKDKEVLVKEPIKNAKIIMVKGKLF